MRLVRFAPLAAVVVFGLPSVASAADLAVKAPAYEPAPVNWTGCYVGAGVGYGMWNQDNQSFIGGVPFNTKHTDGGRGWLGRVGVGCDYQFGQRWLVGVFGDYDFASLKGDLTMPGFAFLGHEKNDRSWAVGGRAGYLPWDKLLLFVSGGYTQAHFNQVDLEFNGILVGFDIPATTYKGWFLGSGYEYKFDLLPGLFWKTEYRFSSFESKNNPVLVTATGAASGFSVDSQKYIQTVTTSLVFRFGYH